MRLRTVTFNMCHGEGLDKKIDVERQGKFLKELNPDIVLLQECQIYGPRVNEIDELEEITKTSEMKYSSMGINLNLTNTRDGGYYGNAFLSNYEITRTANYLMPLLHAENEQRGILYNKVKIEDKYLNTFTLHMATNPEERKLIIEELFKILNNIDKNEYILIGGDFNFGVDKIGPHQYVYSKEEQEKEIARIKEVLDRVENTEDTWFSKTGTGCIDTMFISKNIEVLNFKTIKSDVTDHSAVYAEIELK